GVMFHVFPRFVVSRFLRNRGGLFLKVATPSQNAQTGKCDSQRERHEWHEGRAGAWQFAVTVISRSPDWSDPSVALPSVSSPSPGGWPEPLSSEPSSPAPSSPAPSSPAPSSESSSPKSTVNSEVSTMPSWYPS